MKLNFRVLILFSMIFMTIRSVLMKKNSQVLTVIPNIPGSIPAYVENNVDMFIPAKNQTFKIPEIAEEKIKVNVEAEYPTKVEVPKFLGMKKEYVNTTLYDKEEGKVVEETVVINKPVIQKEEEVMNIKREDTFYLNKNNGSEILPDKELTFHGI